MDEQQKLITQYRQALAVASPLASESERQLYVLHEQELSQLMSLLEVGTSPQSIATLIARERRAFGWAFLSGTHGQSVESTFHKLATALEQQYS